MSSFIPIFTIVGLSLLTFIYFLRSLRHKDSKNVHRLPPGPWALPVLGHLHMLGTLPHRALNSLSKKYGPIMFIRLGNIPTVVVSSPQLAESFLKTHDIIFASRPKSQAAEYMSYGTKGMGFTPYGPYWRNIRKLCTIHLLSKSKHDSIRPMRREEIGHFVEFLKGAAEDRVVVDMSTKVGSLIEEITYKMVTGMSNKDRLGFKPVIDEVMRIAGAFNLADCIPYIAALDLQGLTRRMKFVSKAMDEMLEKVINEHAQDIGKKEQHNHNDFIHVMLSLMESSEEQLDRDNIKAIIMDMLAGGMDTITTATEWALSELFRHPQVIKRVQEELAHVIGLGRMVEETDLTKLEYLEMVVKESMRLHPVAPLLLPHESTEDIVINEFLVPKKSRLIINVWAIGRDPDVWSNNAEDFIPERFYGKNIDVRGNDFELIPFGSGRRGCPGLELGLMTVRLIVAQLMHCFDWELPNGMSPGELDMKEKFGLSVQRATHLHAIPTYRLDVNH